MLNELFNTFSPSGFEYDMHDFLKEKLLPLKYDIRIDNLGTLIAHKDGDGQKICIECGMDTSGIMVTATKDNVAYFSTVGNVSVAFLENKPIRFKNGAYGIVRYNGSDIGGAKISDLFVDIDTGSVSVGDFGAVDSFLRVSDNRIFSNDLSHKIPVKAVLDIAKELNTNKDITLAFTAQKNLGARGINAFFGVNSFDKVITVNSVSANKNIKSGSGCVLIAKDKKYITEQSLLKASEKTAIENGISFAVSVCDENLYIENISTSGNGAHCLCIAIPVEYKSKGFECVSQRDICSASDLIRLIIE